MKIKLTLVAILAMFVFTGCGDDSSPYKCSSCVDEPEALAANDALAKGIYKGVVVGSTGTLKIHFANGDDNITATLIIDGDEFELEPTQEYVEGGFEGTFSNDRGTETQEDDISIGFEVNSDGSGADVYYAIIPHHTNVEIRIFKELSTALVMGFEGTYTGDKTGTFNMVVRLNESGSGAWYSVSKENPADQHEANTLSGEVSEDGAISCNGDVVVAGAIKGDVISGTWESDPDSGTWKGRRTL